MTPRRARALVAGTALVLATALVACGDDPSDEGTPAGATTAAAATTAAGGAATTAASTETTVAAPDTTGAGGSTTQPTTTTTIAKAEGDAEIDAVDFAFDPQHIEVTAGTKVTWTNRDSTTHKIVSKGDPFAGDGDGTIGSGDSYEVTFVTPGTYEYFCGIHNSMTGSIVVT